MGLCNSPDIFQEKMSELMQGLEFVRVYIDDLLCLTTKTYEDHLLKLEEVLLSHHERYNNPYTLGYCSRGLVF